MGEVLILGETRVEYVFLTEILCALALGGNGIASGEGDLADPGV